MIFILYILALWQINAQEIPPLYAGPNQIKWVDSIYNTLSLDEKIGQLFMPYVSSDVSEKNKKHILHLINDLKVGNFFFLKGHPSDEKYLNTFIQANSSIPAITAIDAEWGLAMRLDSTAKFPWNMTLGAIKKDSIIYQIGKEIGKDCKSIGFSMNFSPVLDINTNPDNPIIGNRSFGEDKKNVAEKGALMMKALQNENLLTTAKHFPGHGDTSQDSHKTLPSVHFSYDRIWEVELYPYRKLIPQGLTGIMVAHLKVPALDFMDLPTTLSSQVVTGLLKKKLEYKGLIITDAMNMKGVADFAESGKADLYAFLAGNDVLLGTIEMEKAVKDFKKAYEEGIISEDRLSHSVKKILKAKYWAGLPDWSPTFNNEYIPNHRDSVLNMQAYEQAITLIKNNKNILPVKDITKKIAYVPMGDGSYKTFYDYLNKYTQVDLVSINKSNDIKKLKNYDLVIVGWHKDTSTPWKSFKFSPDEINLLKQITAYKPVILDVFTTPYALVNVIDKITPEAVIISYENNFYTQMLSPQMIFGALPFKGMLPVSINSQYRVHKSIQTRPLKRLSYGYPEQVGIDSKKLKRVDSLMQFMIDTMAAPGGVVLAARNGKVFFEKAYGYQTYDKKRKVMPDDIYDLASVTKVIGATTLMMKAYDEGMFKLTDHLGDLMPLLKGTNKDTITVIEALSHYGKIRAWIPFYMLTIDEKNKKPSWKYYRRKPSSKFNIKITDNLYLKNDYLTKIWDTIATTPQYEKLKYVYSGLPFYLFKKYIEDSKGVPMDKLLDSVFYHPLGANTVTFNPLNKFPASRIAPTEIDDYWRFKTLRGIVHDMGAAMLNGVSGNAGLFGNANDLAKIMQMHLNKGYYGGKRYISDSTEAVFNHRYFAKDSVRRGLGWDKPQFKGKPGPTFEEISPKSFGHQGFTGTMVWADPEEQIVYIFLSNRTYPTMENKLLYELNIRSEVQRRIYEAIINPKHDYSNRSKLNPYEKWKPIKDSVKLSK